VTPIRYLQGDATSPQSPGPKVIAHICNDLGGWGKGFVLAISRRWPDPERDYRAWHRHRADNDFGLGAVRLVRVRPDTWVANMIGQHGMRRGSSGPPIRYDALERCLTRLVEDVKPLHASVHMPRIGTGLAGGDWSTIEPLITAALSVHDIPVTVYDFT
jgi:O-acetyl-ADP-ribose deacetylase (regulator of RNase III)